MINKKSNDKTKKKDIKAGEKFINTINDIAKDFSDLHGQVEEGIRKEGIKLLQGRDKLLTAGIDIVIDWMDMTNSEKKAIDGSKNFQKGGLFTKYLFRAIGRTAKQLAIALLLKCFGREDPVNETKKTTPPPNTLNTIVDHSKKLLENSSTPKKEEDRTYTKTQSNTKFKPMELEDVKNNVQQQQKQDIEIETPSYN